MLEVFVLSWYCCVAERQKQQVSLLAERIRNMNITEITSVKKQINGRLRLAPYCRVSSDSADQLHSFAAQIRYYSEYAKNHPEYELADIYADEGITGTEMKKRDELNRLITDCRKGKIDRVIVKSVSRLARNTEELLVLLRLFKDLGVSVYFEEQGIDTEKLNMEMIVTFPGMAAQQESANISGNMHWSYQKRMQSGDFNCTYPAYGFDLKNGHMTVNEDEAAVVRRIFDLYLQGYGIQNITEILNKDGAPRRYGHSKWYYGTVRYILTNERYIGDALLQKKFTTDTLPYKRKSNNGQKPKYYVENSNPAIVSRETFEAVQELMKSRKTDGCKRTIYPLTGKLRCNECGFAFRRQITRNIPYWICSGRSTGTADCQSRRVKEEAVYETFNKMIFKLKSYRSELLGTLIHQMETMQNRTNISRERIRQIDKEIADLGARNIVIARLHTSGVLNAAEHSMQTAEINNKITELRTERRKRLSEDENDELIDTLKDLNEILEEYELTTEFDSELFGQVIESITVDGNSQLIFELVGGIRLTEQIDEKGRCKSV